MTSPAVSIVMPMLNAAPFVRAAIESALNQQGVDLKLIVIDDGSTDSSVEVVRGINDPRVRRLAGPQRGVAAAFNAGLAAAKGEFLARCDADDLFEPNRLAAQIDWLRGHPEFGAVCGGFATLTPSGDFIRDLECGQAAMETTSELRSGRTRTSFCTWLVRTDLVKRVGGCREFFATAEDIDLQLRLSEACRVWFDPARCYSYRLHDASATHSQSKALRDFYDRTARQLQQQRNRSGSDDIQSGRPPVPPVDGQGTAVGSRGHVQGMLLGAAWDEHAAGRRGKALCTALRACLTSPTNFQAWKSLGVLAIRGQRN